MMRRWTACLAFWAVAMASSWTAIAQGTQPKMVDRTLRNAADGKWALMQYQEAFDLYEVVTYSEMERAQRKGQVYASELLDRTVECGMLAGRETELAALLDSARSWGHAEENHLEARRQLTMALSGTGLGTSRLSQAWVTPLRPGSKDPEYCAVPHGEDLVFVQERRVFGVGGDGWTGRPEWGINEEGRRLGLGEVIGSGEEEIPSCLGEWHARRVENVGCWWLGLSG